MCDNFFIITGGPGAGKTTLIEELRKRGFFCVEDIARKIIRDEAFGNNDRENTQHFTEMLLSGSIEAYEKAMRDGYGTIFFDRGVVGDIGYVFRTNMLISPELCRAASSLTYNKKVFMAPPWEEIYCNDNERIQTYEKALEVYENLRDIHYKYGYEIVELPKTSVEKRADFVIGHI